MRRILLLLSLPLAIASAKAEPIIGPAKVIDAATLRVAGQVFRLHGIAVPAPGDDCPMRGRTIPCGKVAATALMDLTAGAKVRCTPRAEAAGATVATCTAGGYDLSEGMVYTGWARPTAAAPARYREVERGARKRQRGLWRGDFPAAVLAAAR
jgi:endonuclease YncB( thermonuclease family)